MWERLRTMSHRPPQVLAPLWRKRLLVSAGRLLRKAGVERLVCYDIGARWGIWPRFLQLPIPILKVGFEADPAEAKRLVQAGAFDIVVPAGISGETGARTLYIGQQAGCTSIYGPDLANLSRHSEPADFVVVKEVPIQTVTLPQAISEHKLPLPDFIKMDVEGAELEILSAAPEVLEHCSGIFFEARLSPHYRGEGLFGAVAGKLLEHGFSITTFQPVGSFSGAIMLVDASACRNVRIEKRREQLLKSAAFAALLGNHEYAIACLRKVATKKEILFG